MDDKKATQESEKKEYFPPKIVQSQKMTVRASQCMKSDSSCAPGPLQS